jgi:hypothetical protein
MGYEQTFLFVFIKISLGSALFVPHWPSAAAG